MKYLALCLLLSCAHASPLLITGDTLDATAITFEATAAAMASAKPSLTQKQIDDWNVFLPKFKASYHIACELWLAAEKSNDQATMAQVSAIIGALVGQLAQFEELVLVPTDGGH